MIIFNIEKVYFQKKNILYYKMARSKSRSTKKGNSNFGAKALAAVIAALLFAVVSLKPVYKATNHIVEAIDKKAKNKLADDSGCPTGWGIAVHSVVFGLLVLVIMEL